MNLDGILLNMFYESLRHHTQLVHKSVIPVKPVKVFQKVKQSLSLDSTWCRLEDKNDAPSRRLCNHKFHPFLLACAVSACPRISWSLRGYECEVSRIEWYWNSCTHGQRTCWDFCNTRWSSGTFTSSSALSCNSLPFALRTTMSLNYFVRFEQKTSSSWC